MKTVIEMIKENKVVAIIRGVKKPETVLKTVEALAAGGVRLIEVTYDQSSAQGCLETLRSIEFVKQATDGRIGLGVGTVLLEQQVVDAAKAGAMYIISPNTNVEVIKKTKQLGLISIPGAFTPSEIVTAFHAGADFVKLFPAGLLGVEYIKAIRGPLPHIPLLAVGGIDATNVRFFIGAGVCGVGVGGNLVNTKLIEKGDFEAITELAKAYTQQLGIERAG
jgi:2-dehydro-3-deoxyphosphogluconate aldolase / (4S)-4-hydroxy-2-oxoglutarate aldolase